MKFSIVIPTYNRADIIVKSLDSIYAQTFSDWEIIVVDDCSKDNTGEVMKPYLAKGKIKYVRNEINRERSYSRNRGISMAQGEFVTLLDSDDVLYPDCLQMAADFIKENPQAIFFHCLFELLDDDYKPKKRLVFPEVKNPLKSIAKGNFISNIGVFYKRELLSEVKFDEEPVLSGSEDYDLVLNMLLHTGRVDRMNVYAAGVYDHSGRSVHTETLERAKKRIHYLVNKQINNPLFNEKMGAYKNSFLSHMDLYFASFCAVRKMPGKASGYIFKSFFKYPAIVAELTFWKHIFVTLKNIV
jgi:glycosyltransferase involved in cell wall biosynthesis